MVTTPTVFKPEFRANLIFENLQELAVATDIGGGRFVVVWTDFNNAFTLPGNQVGQIFDADGNPLGDPFRVNETVTAGNQQDVALATRLEGGFAVVYESTTGETNNRSIVIDFYDTNGVRTGGTTVQPDDADLVFDPSIAAGTDGGYLVTYERNTIPGGENLIVSRHIAADGTVGVEQTVFSSNRFGPAEVAALTNGNYVVVNVSDTGDANPEFKIIGQDGSVPAGAGTPITTSDETESDVQVAALAGGGFVVVWRVSEDDSLRYGIYDNNGNAINADVPGGGLVALAGTVDQKPPDVAALKDGGFVILWQDDDDGRWGAHAQRFDAGGEKVGDEFLVGGGVREDVFVAGLSDGRFITGSGAAPSGEIFISIYDPRGKTIDGTSGNDVLTSRVDGARVSGLGGDDELLGQDANDMLDGGTGADLMRGRDGDDIYIVDDLGDVAIEDPNEGVDHVYSSVSLSLWANVENLTLIGNSAIDGTGNNLANILIGNNKKNVLDGGAGDDRLQGGLGKDSLTGGTGNDIFVFNFSPASKAEAKKLKDKVLDFSHADDTIELAAEQFALLGIGPVKEKAFGAGTKNPSKDKHILYWHRESGKLYYDANGKKQKGKGDVEIAKFNDDAGITASDIIVA